MKRSQILAFALTFLIACPAIVHSQTNSSELTVSVGGALPTGDFDDGLSGGPGLGVEWTTSASSNVSYGLGAHFNKFGIDQVIKNLSPTISWSSYGVDGVALVKFYLGAPASKTRAYLKGQGGIGTFTLKGRSGSLSASNTQTKPTFGGGVGLTFRGEGNTGGHVELLYNALLTDGATATYVTLRGGITMFFGR